MKKILLIISICIFVNFSFAQSFTNYSYSQALINDNTRCFVQDNENNIWIGSSSGITVFDGNNFSQFNTENGLGGNTIYDFLVHSNGDVYAATSGGLSKWNGSSWTNFNAGSGLPSNVIWCVDEDIYNKIWIGTSSNGVAYFDGINWHTLTESQGLVADGVKCLLADRSGNVWFGTGNGLSMYNGNNFITFNTSNGLPGNIVNEIIQLDNGNIAVATNGGIGIYNYNNWNNITTLQGLPTANVLTINQDKNQNIWLGTSLGLSKFDGSNFTTYNDNHGMSNIIVNKILITKNNNSQIWVGSPFNGLSVFDINEDFIIYRTNKNLVNDNINTIYTDENTNTVWIGTQDGLNKVVDRNWKTYKVSDGLSNNNITCIHKDINNNIWIGTVNGLNKISGQTITSFNLAQGLTNAYINDISSDNSGKIYIATNNKVNVIENNVIIETIGIDEGLANNIIKKIHFENNRMWFLNDDEIQYFDGSNFIDATNLNCSETYSQAGAICSNTTNVQYFGDDYSLRTYDIDNSSYDCIAHPHAGDSKIISMTKIENNIYCVFENGELQYYNGTWTNIPLSFEATWVEHYFDDNYLWIGSQDNGVYKYCINCTQDIVSNIISPTCFNSNNASLTIISPLGNNYSIDNGLTWQSSNNFNNLKPGFKHILIKNISNKIIADNEIYLEPYNGNISSANLTLTQIDCHGNNSGEINLFYETPASHIWENNNTNLFLRQNLSQGTYSVTINDGFTCNKILTNDIIEPPLLNTNLNYNNISCFGNANASISLSISGGTIPYLIEWSNSANTSVIQNLAPNTYSYTVTDAKNCQNIGSQAITQPEQLGILANIQNNFCNGDNDGEILITINGGTSPYNIEWSNTNFVNSENNIVNAPAGSYIISVTDANSCNKTETYNISQPQGILINSYNLTNILCYGENTGKINISTSGGFGELTYEWKKNAESEVFSIEQNLENLEHGTYYLTITDENSCQKTASYTLTQSPELIANTMITPITCAGDNDGQILASATGGSGIYSAYTWYNSENEIIGVNQHITNLGSGEYHVLVRDSYYCYATAYATLTQATPHIYETSHSNMTCHGLNNGSITITIDGGAGAGFNFNWQNGVNSNTNIASNLGPGTYSVTITDPSNCTEIIQETILQPNMESIGSFSEYGYVCYGNSITLNPGSFVTYTWSTGQISPTIEVENQGVYFVEVIDDQGCHLGDTITIIVSTVFNNEKINLTNVDEQGNVKIIWNKTPNQGTEYYNLYKDSGSSYNLLTTLNYNSPAIFIDTDVDTDNHYYKYKISCVDSCGAESQMSEHHRTCLLHAVPDGNGASWLDWGAYEGFFVVYYFIERGSTPYNLTVVDSVLYNQFNWAEMNPNPNGSYYRIKVRRMDGANPGDGNYYSEAYSNIVFCQNITGMVNNAIISPQVYPNPFVDVINIEFYQNIPGKVSYSIVNMLGQTVESSDEMEFSNGKNNLSFNTSLENGVYILILKFKEETYNFRIIKN